MITAPFNFVPLSEKVFFPNWSELVSHDIPFKDGESGEIDITITAESPIFIRDHEDQTRFCNFRGQYYIPGSSIKGMLREVLEIMSFGKMCPGEHAGNMDDVRFAVRDLSNAKNFYFSEVRGAKAGWLEKSEEGYRIVSCGTPGRIGLEEIDRFFGVSFKNHFMKGTFDEQEDERKTAQYKYELLQNLLNERGSDKRVDGEYGFIHERNDAGRAIYRFANSVAAGERRGRLVMTGQPSGRNDRNGKGKNYEFLFFDPGRDPEIIEVPEKKFEEFKFIYFDGRDTQPTESRDWTYWKKRLESGERVPVFYHSKGRQLMHFGLAYLYKLPYKHTTGDGVPFEHKSVKRDLAETIFGYVEGQDALKGRVHVSHARAESGAKEAEEVSLILGAPRASYYPLYLRQNDQTYATYQNDHFRLAGWKRYPVHRGTEESNIQRGNDNEDVVSRFRPLESGATFRGKIRYHNLKPEEIGSILSALTFHGCEKCRHSIGLAKAFGYGKIRVEVQMRSKEHYLKAFELMMNSEIEEWNGSEQIRELLTMATVQNNRDNSELRYMRLDPARHIDEFRKAKKERDYLKYYSRLDGVRAVEAKRYSTREELEAYLERIRQEEERVKNLEREARYRRKESVSKRVEPIVHALKKIVDTSERTKEEKDPDILQDIYETLQKDFAKTRRALEAFYKEYEERPDYEKYFLEAVTELKTAVRLTRDELEKVASRIEYSRKNEKSKSKEAASEALSFEDVFESGKAKQMHTRLKNYLESWVRLDDEQLANLREAIASLYKNAKSKDKKKFFKELQLARLLGREFEEAVKESLDLQRRRS